jgi:hypothetical protein
MAEAGRIRSGKGLEMNTPATTPKAAPRMAGVDRSKQAKPSNGSTDPDAERRAVADAEIDGEHSTVKEESPFDRPLVSLMDIGDENPDPLKTVLGARYLCLVGTLAFIGPSGIGKSSASMQQDILWSLGRPTFGIRPQRPLRILTIQAENDADDLAEMRDGVCRGLKLSTVEQEAVRKRVFYESEDAVTGAAFTAFLGNRLSKGEFDLVRIDPLQAFFDGDISDAKDMRTFCRKLLQPVLRKHNVSCAINHHTPKTNNRVTDHWRASDWMYAGAGSAELINWARAGLVIDPTHAPHTFKFIAAKRGGRIGWVDEAGEREIIRHFCHASDGLYWRDATPGDIEEAEAAAEAKKKTGAKASKTPLDLLAIVPTVGAIPKNVLLGKAQAMGIGEKKARSFLDILIAEGKLHTWGVKRHGTNDEIRISRHENTLF